MSDAPPPTPEPDRRHLRVVGEEREPALRPRTIGRLIAQTALIADGAVSRRELDTPSRGVTGRLLGRFR